MLLYFILGGAALLVVFAVTCGVQESKVGSFVWSRVKRYDSDKAQFRKINGQLRRSIKFKNATHLQFTYSVACETGSLAASVVADGGKRTTLFSGTKVHDEGVQVLPIESGAKYELEIKGEGAKGTYEVAWAPTSQ